MAAIRVGPTGGVDQSLTAARLRRLRDFREEVLCCLGRRRDALFELVDALLAAESMPSRPQLSLLPVHRRSWGSGYAALAVGEVDGDQPPVFAVDARTWARCDAECSPGRGFSYAPTRHSAGQPIVAGWCSSWIAQLGFERDSWTTPLDARRVSPGQDVGQVTAAQIRALTARLDADGTVPLVVCDAGDNPIARTVDLADVAVAVLVRIRADRVCSAAPTPRAVGQLGRPRRHGIHFLGAAPTRWPAPDQTLEIDDEQDGRVQVACWAGRHPTLAGGGRWTDCTRPPIVAGTVIRVPVEHLPRPIARAVTTR